MAETQKCPLAEKQLFIVERPLALLAQGITVFCQLLHRALGTASLLPQDDVRMISNGRGKEKKNPPQIGHAEQGWGQAALGSVVGGN